MNSFGTNTDSLYESGLRDCLTGLTSDVAHCRACPPAHIIRSQSINMTNPGFKDYFSAKAAEYATFRPTYPDRAVRLHRVASSGARNRVGLRDRETGKPRFRSPKHFDRVIATDASAEQIRSGNATSTRVVRRGAGRRERARPRLGRSRDGRAGTALATARAFLRRGAARGCAGRCARCLVLHRAKTWPERSTRSSMQYYSKTCGPYWSPDRRLVDKGYATVAMPFDEVASAAVAHRGATDAG